VCGCGGGVGGPRLVFSVEKRKGNPRCFPQSFCLVKLNANTQKADGLISAQISGFCLGCCRYICPDKDPTALHFHRHSAAVVVGEGIGYTAGDTRGGEIKVRNILR